MAWPISSKKLKMLKPRRLLNKIIRSSTKIKRMSPYQRKRRAKLLRVINKHEKRIKELLRIEIYDLALLNKLVREFLAELFDFKLGLTSSEIKERLNKKKLGQDVQRRIYLFLHKLDKLRYSTKEIMYDEKKTMMEDLDLIIQDLKNSI